MRTITRTVAHMGVALALTGYVAVAFEATVVLTYFDVFVAFVVSGGLLVVTR